MKCARIRQAIATHVRRYPRAEPSVLHRAVLGGKLDVIHAPPCEARFRRLFPIILLVPHLFWPSSARQRTSLALRVGSCTRLSRLAWMASSPLALAARGGEGSSTVAATAVELERPQLALRITKY